MSNLLEKINYSFSYFDFLHQGKEKPDALLLGNEAFREFLSMQMCDFSTHGLMKPKLYGMDVIRCLNASDNFVQVVKYDPEYGKPIMEKPIENDCIPASEKLIKIFNYNYKK